MKSARQDGGKDCVSESCVYSESCHKTGQSLLRTVRQSSNILFLAMESLLLSPGKYVSLETTEKLA